MKWIRERRLVLEAAREISETKMVIGTWGNVSMRAQEDPYMLITPSGMNYKSMSIDDIVLVDFDCKVIKGEWQPSSESPLHAAVYKNKPAICGIVHVHSPYATAFGVAHRNIPVVLEETAEVIGHEIPVLPYYQCGTTQLADHVVEALEGRRALLLANHGLVGVGRDLFEAMRVVQIAERTAMIAFFAHNLGGCNVLGDEDIASLNSRFRNYGQSKPKF